MLGGDLVRPSARELALEAALVLVLGIVHSRVARDNLRGSPMLPGALLIAATLGHVLLSGSTWQIVALSIIGLAAMVMLMTVVLRAIVPLRAPIVIVSIALVLIARVASVGTDRLDALAYPLTSRLAPSSESDAPSIVIITVDTLRADAASTMESFQFLAERGASWPRAMASSSWTVPSLVTLFTGEPSGVHGAGNTRSGFAGPSPTIPMLAEELSEHGYTSAAFVTNAFVDNPAFGLRRGFDRWRYAAPTTVSPLMLLGYPDGSRKKIDSAHLIDSALSFIERAPERGVLLWVHLLDPHLPYTHGPPEDRFDAGFLRQIRAGRIWSPPIRTLRRAYERQVAYVDGQIMRLLEGLEARGHFERGVVVFASDHGEEFWEHDGFEHGHSHHGEVVDVPLVLVAPGLPVQAGTGVASLADVAPTIRGIVGLDPRGLDLRGGVPTDRVARAAGNLYGGFAKSSRTVNTRVIVDVEGARAYDLQTDPHELNPRPPRDMELEELDADARSISPADAPVPIPDMQVEGLRALGYVQ
jgi:arylsulfatase A-like enzyme